jgi:hypothetical protein
MPARPGSANRRYHDHGVRESQSAAQPIGNSSQLADICPRCRIALAERAIKMGKIPESKMGKIPESQRARAPKRGAGARAPN